MDRTTLWRLRQRHDADCVEEIRYKYAGRPPHKLTEERLEEAAPSFPAAESVARGGAWWRLPALGTTW